MVLPSPDHTDGILQLISASHLKPESAESAILAACSAHFEHWRPAAAPVCEWKASDLLDFISQAMLRGWMFHPKQIEGGDSFITLHVGGNEVADDIILLAFQVFKEQFRHTLDGTLCQPDVFKLVCHDFIAWTLKKDMPFELRLQEAAAISVDSSPCLKPSMFVEGHCVLARMLREKRDLQLQLCGTARETSEAFVNEFLTPAKETPMSGQFDELDRDKSPDGFFLTDIFADKFESDESPDGFFLTDTFADKFESDESPDGFFLTDTFWHSLTDKLDNEESSDSFFLTDIFRNSSTDELGGDESSESFSLTDTLWESWTNHPLSSSAPTLITSPAPTDVGAPLSSSTPALITSPAPTAVGAPATPKPTAADPPLPPELPLPPEMPSADASAAIHIDCDEPPDELLDDAVPPDILSCVFEIEETLQELQNGDCGVAVDAVTDGEDDHDEVSDDLLNDAISPSLLSFVLNLEEQHDALQLADDCAGDDVVDEDDADGCLVKAHQKIVKDADPTDVKAPTVTLLLPESFTTAWDNGESTQALSNESPDGLLEAAVPPDILSCSLEIEETLQELHDCGVAVMPSLMVTMMMMMTLLMILLVFQNCNENLPSHIIRCCFPTLLLVAMLILLLVPFQGEILLLLVPLLKLTRNGHGKMGSQLRKALLMMILLLQQMPILHGKFMLVPVSMFLMVSLQSETVMVLVIMEN